MLPSQEMFNMLYNRLFKIFGVSFDLIHCYHSSLILKEKPLKTQTLFERVIKIRIGKHFQKA